MTTNSEIKKFSMDSLVKTKSDDTAYETLNYFYKFGIALLLISLVPILFPQKTFAYEKHIDITNAMVFEYEDDTQFFEQLSSAYSAKYKHETTVLKLKQQIKLNAALKKYLISKGSPLAEYTYVILQQNNWKKILALSNAESSMCKRYIESIANCWGVGGSDLWHMGDNLGDAVVTMNNFLNTAPKKSRIKYSQMSFEQMNGLYKQPAGDHWVYNNLEIYNELTALEKNIK
jgi:hypothetical protein